CGSAAPLPAPLPDATASNSPECADSCLGPDAGPGGTGNPLRGGLGKLLGVTAGAEAAGPESGCSPGKLNALICGSSGMSPSTCLRSAALRGTPPLAATASIPSFKSEAILR